MDEPRLALLQGDLQGQWEIVDGVFSRIAARHGRIAARQGRRSASVEQVEALAYQLHNLYGACEGALRAAVDRFLARLGAGGADDG